MRKIATIIALLWLLALGKRPAEALTSYPTSLDTNTTLFQVSTGDTLSEAHHNNLKDAVIALQTKVGVDSSADATSLDYLLTNSASINPGHKHTGSSITFEDGSAAAPGLVFGNPSTDTTTGLFHDTSGEIAVASTGVEIVRVTGTGLGVLASPFFPVDVAGTVRIRGSNDLCFGGTGASDNDTCIDRSAAHIARVQGSLRIEDQATTDNSVTIVGIAAKTGEFLQVFAQDSDTQPIVELIETGVLRFGAGGASAPDTNLYRSAADTLKTDDSFVVGTNVTVSGTGTQTIGGAGATSVLSGDVVTVLDAATNLVTLADSTNIVLNTGTGTKIGTATTQKLGFYNATPIVQPGGTTDLRTALINLGLYATGGASPLDLNGGALTTTGTATLSGLASPHGNLAVVNGANANVALTANTTVFRLTGPTGAFSISGLTGGTSGRMVVLISTVSQTLTITNEATSTAANQITTNTAADIVCTASEKAVITLVYDATSTKWIVTSVMNCATV